MSLMLTKLAYSIAAYPIKLYRLRDNSVQGQKVQREDNSNGSMHSNGSKKLPLFVIGKSIKPRCFKNVKNITYRVYGEQKSMDGGDSIH